MTRVCSQERCLLWRLWPQWSFWTITSWGNPHIYDIFCEKSNFLTLTHYNYQNNIVTLRNKLVRPLRKSLIGLVKSSLVFVLVGGCLFDNPHIFSPIPPSFSPIIYALAAA